MADGTEINANPTGSDTPPAAPATQPQLVQLTPEQYQVELQKAKDAGAAAARRALEGRQPPKAEPPKSQPDPVQNAAQPSHDQSFEDSLADALADLSGMTRKQRSLVRDLARQKRPSDVDAFVAELAETLGVQKTATNPNPQSSTASVAAATPPATPSNGQPPQPPAPPPVTRVTSDLPTDVRKWSEDQWNAFYAQNGADPGTPLSWKNRHVHRDIAKRLEASMAHVRIKPR